MLFEIVILFSLCLANRHSNSIVTLNKFAVNNHDIKKILRHELIDVLPLINEQFETNFRNRNIDFANYRDVFFVSKKVSYFGNKKKVEYKISEKILPKKIPEKYHTFFIWSFISLFFIVGVSFTFFIKYKKLSMLKKIIN